MKFKPKLKEKRWNVENELKLLEIWEKEGVMEFENVEDKPIFSIDTPPPYASGSWHVGAAAHYCQFDMFARYFRLKGYQVLFPMGIDRNGLPIEIRVEQKYGIRAREVDREYFIRLCRENLDIYEKDILDIVRRMGMMARYWDPYRTDSPDYRALTQATFIELWKKGLIYEDDRPTIWCPVCHTTIAEAEVEYKTKDGFLYYVRFPLEEGGYIVIATTRPELIGATAAVMYNPEDGRYRDLEGKKALLPIYNKPVPIIPHPIVDPEYGTGLMMLSSFGDLTDVRLFRELGFEPNVLIDKDGCMNEKAGKYKGLTVEEARKAIVNDLKEMGLLEKSVPVKQNVPMCWRSRNPVEFIITRDLYLKQIEFKEELKRLADKIRFFPEIHKTILINWIESLSIDWAITRTRYYGTEVPLWYCKKCGHPHVPEPGRYYRPWKDPAPFDECEKCGHKEFVGDPRTFDTWMDSSVSALYISGYGKDEKLFNRAFPVSVRPQGIDIVRTWLHYSLLRIYLLTGKPAFKMIRLSGMGLDEHGHAMHKSLGNVVLPMPILSKYGADAFRVWSASETKLGFNYRYSEAKIEAARRFITKLWNVARFISMFPYINDFNKNHLLPLDKQIIVEVDKLINTAREEYETLDFFYTTNNLKNFVWNIYASHYLELVKNRAYNYSGEFSETEQKSAWYTLHRTLKTILLLLHPVAPFVTDYIWRKLYNPKGILSEKFPEPSGFEVTPKFDLIMKLDSAIWKFKESRGLSLKDGISEAVLPKALEEFHKDIKATHNIKEIKYDDSIDVESIKLSL